MENTKAISQSRVLDEFYAVMKKNEDRVAYGEKEVYRCIEMKAVAKLLISDYLFRNKDFEKRRKTNRMYDQVKQYGGEAVIFSTLHPSGKKLENITGIAAILRYDVPALEEENDEEFEETPNQLEELDEDKEEIGKIEFKNFEVEEDEDEDADEEYEVEEKVEA